MLIGGIRKMTISHQEQYKRYRVYIPLGHRDSIQRVFGYGKQGKYNTPKEALEAAEEAHERLTDEHAPVDLTNPFTLDIKHRVGTRRESPMEIRNMILMLSTCKSHLTPDWTITRKYKSFHTYPPCFCVQRFDYTDGVRKTLASHRIPINSSRSYALACREAVDAYIGIYPDYESYRDEMIRRMPQWSVAWEFIQKKANKRYEGFKC